MKKLIACVLLFTMCISGFAACSKETSGNPEPTVTTAPTATTAPTEAPVDTVSDLTAAKNYLFTMYKDATEATPADYTVVGVVNIGGVLFNIDWTVDNETVKIIPGDNKMVTIDVDDKNPEEVGYTLTATLSDDKGNKEVVSFFHRVPAAIIIDGGMSYAEIVDAAYALETDLSMEGTYRLFGTITAITSAWSDKYQNITVVLTVAGKEDKPITCYRLAGEGADKLAVGDAITVEGTFKNYNGTIEFDQGCVLVGMGEKKDQSKLVEAAYAVEENLSMTEPMTLTGVITKITSAWSDKYQNITVVMVVDGIEDKPITCYRLAGEGADKLAVGDEITVTGTIKNYKGEIEFDQGCTLDAVVAAAGAETPAPTEVPAPTEAPVAEEPSVDPAVLLDAEKLLEAAYALETGASFPSVSVMKGVIASIDTEYSEKYGNITVTIVVNGKSEKPVQCFRLKGEGAATLAVGDEIAVMGTLKNYNGIIEFDAGCQLVATDAYESVRAAVTAYALKEGAALTEEKTVTGVIASVDTDYSEKYGNVTVTIVVAGLEDYKIQCFRLKGEGADTIAAGDTITVTGILKNYNGKIEFDAGCTLGEVVKAN